MTPGHVCHMCWYTDPDFHRQLHTAENTEIEKGQPSSFTGAKAYFKMFLFVWCDYLFLRKLDLVIWWNWYGFAPHSWGRACPPLQGCNDIAATHTCQGGWVPRSMAISIQYQSIFSRMLIFLPTKTSNSTIQCHPSKNVRTLWKKKLHKTVTPVPFLWNPFYGFPP